MCIEASQIGAKISQHDTVLWYLIRKKWQFGYSFGDMVKEGQPIAFRSLEKISKLASENQAQFNYPFKCIRTQ